MDAQLLNMLRYELFRIDQDRTMLVPQKTFKDIYRNLNIKMPLDDFNFFVEYMKMNAKPYRDEYDEKQYLARLTAVTPAQKTKAKQFDTDLNFEPTRMTNLYRREKVNLRDCSTRMTLNLRNLSKIIDACAKLYWKRISDKIEELNHDNDG